MRKLLFLAVWFAFVIGVAACNMPVGGNAGAPTQGPGGVQTAAAQTVQALLATQAAGQPATEEPQATEAAPTEQQPPTLPTAVISTVTPLPSLTPLGNKPTSAPQTTAAPTPCNRASFVDDVTVPDGTNFAPGTTFTKTWRLKNSGTCTWSGDYKIVFSSGDAMSGPASANLPGSVPPNATVDLSVTLKAPTAAKTYQGNWKLQDASGASFGLGSKGDQPFWVKIVVGSSGTPTLSYFAVTSAGLSAAPANYEGTCPTTLKLTAKITVSTGGTVTYFWERSDGKQTKKRSLEFDKGGAKSVTETLENYSESFDGTYRLYVDNPNYQYFGPLAVKITCQ